MSVAGAVGRVAARYGTAYTLRRSVPAVGSNVWTAGAETVSYSTCAGRERHDDAKTINGALEDGQQLITLDAAKCSVAPQNGDRIARGYFIADAGAEWRQITNVYSVQETGTVSVYKLTVRA